MYVCVYVVYIINNNIIIICGLLYNTSLSLHDIVFNSNKAFEKFTEIYDVLKFTICVIHPFVYVF